MMHSPKQASHGFSLIEVLIALLILAIGMLALAASEVMGQRGTHSALKRSYATTLANDLAERIHANPTGDYTADLSGDSNDACPVEVEKTCVLTRDTPTIATGCTADQMATYDLKEWFCGNGSYRDGVMKLLGGPGRPSEDIAGQIADATITCDDSDTHDELTCSAGSTYSISLTWRERESNRETNNVNFAHGVLKEKNLELVVVP
jgi:type IV pilus modification protein PilV